jgi:hypothetical protein
MSSESTEGRTQDWRRLLLAVLDEDGPTLLEISERLGGHQGVVLLTCFIAVAVPERFGTNVTFEELSDYAAKISNEVDNDPRQIVLEAVLRAGVGNFGSLDGFSEDEILAATGLVMRKVVADLKKSSNFEQSDLVGQVLEIASFRGRAGESN